MVPGLLGEMTERGRTDAGVGGVTVRMAARRGACARVVAGTGARASGDAKKGRAQVVPQVFSRPWAK
ncbi:hypothetical protein GCM10010518_00170 [Kitasatospora cinereorecta]